MLEQLVVLVVPINRYAHRLWLEEEAPGGWQLQQTGATFELIGGVPAVPLVIDERADRLRRRRFEPGRRLDRESAACPGCGVEALQRQIALDLESIEAAHPVVGYGTWR